MAKTNFAFSPVVHSFQTQLTMGSERVGFVEIERQPLKRVSRALALANRMTRQRRLLIEITSIWSASNPEGSHPQYSKA